MKKRYLRLFLYTSVAWIYVFTTQQAIADQGFPFALYYPDRPLDYTPVVHPPEKSKRPNEEKRLEDLGTDDSKSYLATAAMATAAVASVAHECDSLGVGLALVLALLAPAASNNIQSNCGSIRY